MQQTEELKQRFIRCWSQLPDAADPEPVWQYLRQQYTQPHRHYHGLSHIWHCLQELDQVRPELQQPLAAELALWFHDCVYDPTRTDNEARSAEVFDAVAEQLPEELRQEVKELIILTRHSGAEPAAGTDGAFVVDIDLAVLGQPPAAYRLYTQQVRQEYSFVPEAQFRQGRARVLQHFLAQPRLYRTAYFSRKYERQARLNLQEELRQLSPEAGGEATGKAR